MAGLEAGNGEKSTDPDDIPEMVAIARYNGNGSLDTTFGSDGVALLNNASVFQGIDQIALLTTKWFEPAAGGASRFPAHRMNAPVRLPLEAR